MVFSILYVAKIPSRFFAATFLLFVVALSVVGFDVYRYYQFKPENPQSDDAVTAYQDHSLVPLKDFQRKQSNKGNQKYIRGTTDQRNKKGKRERK